VLQILIDNAIKFTPDGEVHVEIAAGDDDTLHAHVRDTGIGISDDFRPFLFEPFRQESMGEQREFEGNGLNLSIAKRLVDLIGGDIHVESTKGVGSTFTVDVPQSDETEATAAVPMRFQDRVSASRG
jgi:signal transduction histidine kinase